MMFELCSTLLAHEPPYCVSLRCCECSDTLLVDTDKFQTITPDHVILKENVNITCEKCGASQPKGDNFITFETELPSAEISTAPMSDIPYWMKRHITAKELLRAIHID